MSIFRSKTLNYSTVKLDKIEEIIAKILKFGMDTEQCEES